MDSRMIVLVQVITLDAHLFEWYACDGRMMQTVVASCPHFKRYRGTRIDLKEDLESPRFGDSIDTTHNVT